MRLVKRTSKIPKHKGCIFLKEMGTLDNFVCKVYASRDADRIADVIIRSMKEVEIADRLEMRK